MTTPKSCGAYILGAYEALFLDIASQYPALTKELKRDYSRLCSAVDSHGLWFVLEDMPTFDKHFVKCLSSGRLTPSHLRHFCVQKRDVPIPHFLRGLVMRVFDRSGVIKSSPDIVAIRLIRQVLRLAKKMRLPTTVKRVSSAVQEFFSTDRDIMPPTLEWNGDDFDPANSGKLSFTDDPWANGVEPAHFQLDHDSALPYGLAANIQACADILACTLGLFDPYEWKARHGPGAVSDAAFGENKYSLSGWSNKLDRVFPWADFAIANYGCVEYLHRGENEAGSNSQELKSKLCAVPKEIGKPRLIAIEPTANQWCQQVIRDFFYQRVSRTAVASFIDFRRQDKNGSLALSASHDDHCATIDLSSASDRISCWHVERLFRRSPALLEALWASRTSWIRQDICRYSPDLQGLRKYSTMGNATTFPVQSLFFLAIALGSVCYARRLRPSLRMMRDLGERQVRVFGDDIIVPKDCAGVVVDALEALCLRVNPNKTFLSGKFKESCGVDAYDGHDVTPISILYAPQRASPGSIVSSVDVHNNACSAGLMHLAGYIQKATSRIVSNRIRYVTHGSGLFGFSSLFGEQPTLTKVRTNRSLMIRETFCLKPKVSAQRAVPEDCSGLLQFFTEAPNQVTSAISSLGFLTRRPKARLALGWATD